MTAIGKRVLVMDDEDVVCKSYERVLTEAGFDVDKAHSGPEALAEANKHDYDVMLADLKMPGMDGLKVVEKLRETKPEIPVVVITGFPGPDTLHEAARLGVSDYLTKPVTPDVLTQATLQALAAQWHRSPEKPLMMQMPQPPEITAIPMTARLPTAPILWPEQPVAVPARPVVREKVTEATGAVAPVTEREPGWLHTAGRLALAPLISLAYVMFLPLLGFAMFIGLGSKALCRKIGGLM